MAHLIAGLIERHDRARFEVIAVALGADDQGDMRARLKRAFDRFIDVDGKSDRDAALLIRELEVDIVVDLMGFTLGCRPAILAFRSAPVQVNYLSYPGIVGTGHIDYTLADRFVIPEDQRALFHEPVVYLPDTYLGYDAEQRISERTPTRAELGLPEAGFVFCAYNNTFKILPPVFDVMDAVAEQSPGQRVVAVGNEHHRHGQSAARGHGARHRSRPIVFCAVRQGNLGSPGALSADRPVPRYAAVQRPHHRLRCALGRRAGAHLPWHRRSSGGWRRVF